MFSKRKFILTALNITLSSDGARSLFQMFFLVIFPQSCTMTHMDDQLIGPPGTGEVGKNTMSIEVARTFPSE